MIKIFKILDLVVSLVLVALGVAVYFLTKNWWAVGAVGVAYIIWEIIVFKTFFKANKFNQDTWHYGYGCGRSSLDEGEDDSQEDEDWEDDEEEEEDA
jgi:hypothetical protein